MTAIPAAELAVVRRGLIFKGMDVREIGRALPDADAEVSVRRPGVRLIAVPPRPTVPHGAIPSQP